MPSASMACGVVSGRAEEATTAMWSSSTHERDGARLDRLSLDLGMEGRPVFSSRAPLTDADMLEYVLGSRRLYEACGAGRPNVLRVVNLSAVRGDPRRDNSWVWAVLPKTAEPLLASPDAGEIREDAPRSTSGLALHFLPSFLWDDPDVDLGHERRLQRLKHAMEAVHDACPAHSPALYSCDVETEIMAMEYLGAASDTLWQAIVDGRIVHGMARQLGAYLASTLFENSALARSAAEFTAMQNLFSDEPLHDTLLRVVDMGACSNSTWTSLGLGLAGLEDGAATAGGDCSSSSTSSTRSSRSSSSSFTSAGGGRRRSVDSWSGARSFKTSSPKRILVIGLEALAQRSHSRWRVSLVHGNLHLGKLFCRPGGGLKVLPDPETARISTPALDLGTVIGQLLAAYFALDGLPAVGGREEQREDQRAWLLNSVVELYDAFAGEFLARWSASVAAGRDALMCPRGKFGPMTGEQGAAALAIVQRDFMGELLHDTIQVAAASLLPWAQMNVEAFQRSVLVAIPRGSMRQQCQARCEAFAKTLAYGSRSGTSTMSTISLTAAAIRCASIAEGLGA